MWWEIMLVAGLAAVPWMEALVVVPLGIGLGLHPLTVGLVTFAGNFLPLLVIAAGVQHWQAWWNDRTQSLPEGKPNWFGRLTRGRQERLQNTWHRYGLPGLALIAPILTGVHFATAAALVLGDSPRRVLTWMAAGLAIWIVILAVVSFYGLEGIRAWL